ncbi:MAG: SufS family cysteine desulfurase [Clostridiales Family XIII bacterium]|jgi:cysteine desulfurase/selenocysteine lyase|nr:SufS family cysteine desulfurase [Clostridiales Family XIII bacterium]
MTIAREIDFGLPTEKEVAQIASAYFPEYAQGVNAEYAPTSPSEADVAQATRADFPEYAQRADAGHAPAVPAEANVMQTARGADFPEYTQRAGAGHAPTVPSEADVARVASAYFPEYAQGVNAGYAPTTASKADVAAQAAQAASAYSPEYAQGTDVGYAPTTASEANVAQEAASAYSPEYTQGTDAGYAPALLSEAEAEAAPPVLPSGIAPQSGFAPDVRRETATDSDAYEKSKYIGDYSLAQIRADFPILSERVDGGNQLVWLDNAATTQRPRQVIDRLAYYYEHENSNVHRGAHTLAARSTDAYEDARGKIADFIGAPSADNIVFVRGTTEGINLVANAFVKQLLKPGDEIVLTILEHHANIVPWQIIAHETGAVLKVAPVDDDGQIILSEYARLFGSRTKFASLPHVSNALGTITPIAELIQIAHGFGVPVLVDGAQSVPHAPVNVTALDADFFVFSGHKLFGPTGIGAVYGKSEYLEAAKPWQGGGNMIKDVTFERTIYHKAPQKFEAGTGNIADAVGLGAAIDYVTKIGIANIAAYEHELLEYAQTELRKIPGLRLIGTAMAKASVLSFVLEGHTPEEVGQRLSEEGIAVRAGHHCAQPILRRFGLEGTVRPSLAFYNTPHEIDLLVSAVRRIQRP